MSRRWNIAGVVFGLAFGLPAGLGAYTFIYARGLSYMTDDPAACANCHVMSRHYDAWSRSSHHAVAVCNDCHTPHGFFDKYMTKASNGYHHSLAFTTGRFHEPIEITPGNRGITEDACRRCHEDIVREVDDVHTGQERISCIRCHSAVGHWD